MTATTASYPLQHHTPPPLTTAGSFSPVQVMSRMHNAVQSVLSSSHRLSVVATAAVATEAPAINAGNNVTQSTSFRSTVSLKKSSGCETITVPNSMKDLNPSAAPFIHDDVSEPQVNSHPSGDILFASVGKSNSTLQPTSQPASVQNLNSVTLDTGRTYTFTDSELQAIITKLNIPEILPPPPSEKPTNQFLMDPWEISSMNSSSVLATTTRQLLEINRSSSRTNDAPLSMFPVEARLSSLKAVEPLNPLKRKSEIPLKTKISKKRRMANSSLLHDVKKSSGSSLIQSRLHLLSPILTRTRQDVTSEALSQKRPSTKPSSSTSSEPPTSSNSLLSLYDPIKILSRHKLHNKSTLRNSGAEPSASYNINATVIHQSNSTASLRDPFPSRNCDSVPKRHNYVSNPKAPPLLPSRVFIKPSTVIYTSESSTGSAMPPPKYPPSWSEKRRVGPGHEGNAGGTSQPSNKEGLEQSNFTVQRLQDPYMLPKIDLALSSRTTSRGVKVKYEAPVGEKCSREQVRLSVVANARKIVRRDRRRNIKLLKNAEPDIQGAYQPAFNSERKSSTSTGRRAASGPDPRFLPDRKSQKSKDPSCIVSTEIIGMNKVRPPKHPIPWKKSS
jgi:hypothetical protein